MMSFEKLKELMFTALPMLWVGVALWGVNLAYEAHWIAELDDARLAALLIWVAAHLLMPAWATTRRSWGLALVVQAPILFANYVAFFSVLFAPPRGLEHLHHPGVGGAFVAMGLLVLFFAFQPFSYIAALFGRRWVGGPDVNEDGHLVLNPKSDRRR